MNQNKLIAGLVLAVILLLLLNGAVYTVDERQKAVVVRFGQVIRFDDAPGLHWKYPFGAFGYDTLRVYDGRILTLDADPEQFLTSEKKAVVVDFYVKWRIDDLVKFYVAVGGDEFKARERLSQVIKSGLRDEFGKRTLHEVVSGDRRKIMDVLMANAAKDGQEYGMKVVDVRVQRVELPTKVSDAVYDRMRAERTRIAKELRAQGDEAAEKIRANADRQREVLVAEAYREAERTRGEGDARATAIYSSAYGVNPEFYALYRSLAAYKESFKSKDDIMVVDPSADFFKYLKNPRRGAAAQ